MPDAVLHIDLETRSAVDLRKVGAHRYAEDPTTEIVCGSYRFDDGAIRTWFGGEIPDDILAHIAEGGPMVGHNQQFERAILNAYAMRIAPAQQNCTMARALALGLPASLEQVGEALRAPIRKDKEGHRLMMSMCRPRSQQENGDYVWRDDPDSLQRLGSYCVQDVQSECAVDLLLPPLSERERRVWELDQRINDLGFAVDLPMVRKALAVVNAASKKADKQIWRLTNGAVNRCTETAKIVSWINAQGVPCKSIAKGEIDELECGAEFFDRPKVAEVVKLRRATARSSTAKYRAMLDSACADGRIRGTLNYHRAHTGRWGGSGVQPQNFPRVDDPQAVQAALSLLGPDGPPNVVCDSIEFWCGSPIEILSKCLRAMIVAPEGRELIGGDFSNIEGRINAWINGEDWKLKAFEAYDAGTGPDLYYVMAAQVSGKPIEELTKVERQVKGKVPELALGYQGALGAFQKMAYTQDPPVRIADDEAKRIVALWRELNPNIVQGWWELQDVAIEAVGAPGCVVSALGGKVRYVSANGFLFCRLPSTRVIAYPRPRLVWKEIEIDGGERVIERRAVEYMGVDSLTKKWGPQALYGGSQMNHVVQGVARDRMVEAMFRVDEAGIPIVLTVHDELLSEADEGTVSPEDYAALMMMAAPKWASGLPTAVKTWKDKRYVK